MRHIKGLYFKTNWTKWPTNISNKIKRWATLLPITEKRMIWLTSCKMRILFKTLLNFWLFKDVKIDNIRADSGCFKSYNTIIIFLFVKTITLMKVLESTIILEVTWSSEWEVNEDRRVSYLPISIRILPIIKHKNVHTYLHLNGTYSLLRNKSRIRKECLDFHFD